MPTWSNATERAGSPRRRMHGSAVLIAAALLCGGLATSCGDSDAKSTAAPSQSGFRLPSGEPVPIQTDAEPDTVTAADDPVPPALYTQFPDDELYQWSFASDFPQTSFVTGSAIVGVGTPPFDLAPPVATFTSIGDEKYPRSSLEVTRGRVVSNDADQLIAMTKTAVDDTSDPDDCFYVDYSVQGFLNPAVSTAAFPSYDFRACLAARPLWQLSPFAIAAGDLDWQVDAAGELHDEVVLAAEAGNGGITPPGGVMVAVLDYAATPGQVTPTSFTLPWDDANAFNRLDYPAAQGGSPHEGQLRIAVFNPQLTFAVREEMIATLHTGPQGYVLNVLRYAPPDADAGTSGALSVYATQILPRIDVSAPIDLAAGDIDGDGHDEIIVLYPVNSGGDTPGGSCWGASQYGLRLAAYGLQAGSPGALALKAQHDLDANYVLPHCDSECFPPDAPGPVSSPTSTARVVTGLFDFIPGATALTRRQIGVTYWRSSVCEELLGRVVGNEIVVKVLSYQDGGGLSEDYVDILDGGGDPGPLDLAAGNFGGVDANPLDPLWSLAVGVTLPENGFQYSFLWSSPFAPMGGESLPSPVPSGYTGVQQRLLAFDYDGDSLYLGPPVVFTASGVSQPLAVLEQPPQHLDYRPNADGASANTGIVNVSRYPNDFKLTFSQGTASEIQSTGATMNSATFGNSSAFSSQESVGRRIPFIGKVTASGSYASASAFARENSSTSSAGTTTSIDLNAAVSPGADDAVLVMTQDWRIWRYRLYGPESTDPENPNLFYEVQVPLTAKTAWTPGLNVDQYQPLHENGNLFSYPDVDTVLNGPADLGGWRPPLLPPQCTMAPPADYADTSLLTPGGSVNVFTFGGVPQNEEIKVDNTQTCGAAREASKTLSDESEWETALQTKTKIPFVAKVQTENSYQNTTSNESSWSTVATTDSTYSVADQITIAQGVNADSFFSYQFAPALYFGQGGNLRIRFGADALDNTIWTSRDQSRGGYGFPDPALNLPYKFVTPAGEPDEVAFNFSLSGSRIRGFFLRDGTPDVVDGVSGLGPVLGGYPTRGDVVQLEARIYNYSFTSPVGPIPVRFDIADYDSCSESVSNRRVLGTVTAQFTDEVNGSNGASMGTMFPPRGVGRAVFTLDTSTLPPAGNQTICGDSDQTDPDGPAHEYAIFVVIDPEGTLTASGSGIENHGWRDTAVLVVPVTSGGCGDVTLTVLTDAGETAGTVVVRSQGSPSADIQCLAAAFENPSACSAVKQDGVQLAQTYDLDVEAVPPFIAGVSAPQFLRIRSDQPLQLPASDDFDATLAFQRPVAGTSALHFDGSVANPCTGTVPSVYTTDLQLGQNNEGVGYLIVQEPDVAAATTDLFFKSDSLGVVDRSLKLQTERAVVTLGTPARVRVCGHSREPYGGYTNIALSLGDPRQGGTPLALKRLGAIPGDRGTCTWFQWTPAQRGEFTLRAELEEPRGDTAPTNNVVEVAVRVAEE